MLFLLESTGLHDHCIVGTLVKSDIPDGADLQILHVLLAAVVGNIDLRKIKFDRLGILGRLGVEQSGQLFLWIVRIFCRAAIVIDDTLYALLQGKRIVIAQGV